MKKSLQILMVLGLLGLGARGQNCLWAKDAGGKSTDMGNSVASDHNGNVYAVGDFYSDSIYFDAMTIYHYYNQNHPNAFFVKYDGNGNVLWAKSLGESIDFTAQASSIAIDNDNNIYVTGNYGGDSIIFGNYTLHSGGLFIVKYDGAGNVLWAKSPTVGGGEAYSITTDLNNNILLTGQFQNYILGFDTVTLTFPNTWWGSELFVFKFDSNGNAVWGRSSGSYGYGVVGNSITTDNSGNVYVTGFFSTDTCYFDTITVINNYFYYNNGYGTEDMFLAKYDSSGVIQWVKSAGGNEESWGSSVSCDPLGHVYIIGSHNSGSLNNGDHIILDSITLINNNYSSVMHTTLPDLFIAKYDGNGNVQWAKGGNANYEMGTLGMAISTDLFGNVFATGTFCDSLTINSTTLYNGGVFLIKFASDGSTQWAQSVNNGGSSYVNTDPNGYVYITGYFQQDSATFGSNTIYNDSALTRDIFIAKYGNTITTIQCVIPNLPTITLYPNPATSTLVIKMNKEELAEVTLYDITSRKLLQQSFTGSTTLTIESLAKGIYLYEIKTKDGLLKNGKVVKE